MNNEQGMMILDFRLNGKTITDIQILNCYYINIQGFIDLITALSLLILN